MNFGNTREALAERSILHEGDRLISERAFNMILGGTLLWGFLLNWLTVVLFSGNVVKWVYEYGTGMFYIGYFVLAISGSFMLRSESPLVSFIGYNLIAVPIGLLLCVALYGMDVGIVQDAVLYTGIITACFMAAALIKPDFFLSMGRTLIFALSLMILGEVILSFFTRTFVNIDFLAAGMFGMFIGFDWARCCVCQPTANNAVDSAANLYLDIINLFLRVLRIMARSRSRD